MEALRETTVVENHVLTLRLPDSFTAKRVEVIVLALGDDPVSLAAPSPRRLPSSKLIGTRLLDDLTAPAVPDADWDALK